MNDLTLYHVCQPMMRSGDLIEWRSNSAVGWLIRKFTKQNVNHSSLLLRFDYKQLADRRFVMEALGDGLEFNILSERLKTFGGEVYWSALLPEYDYCRPRIEAYAILKKAQHIKYDYASLFKQILGRVSVDAKKFFCSEFYLSALIKGYVVPNRKKALRPGEFGSLGVLAKSIRIL